MVKKKQKTKTRVIYRKAKPSFDKEKERKELQELEQKRQQIHQETEQQKVGKKGFSRFAASLGGFTRKASINKAISQKRKVLGTQQKMQQVQSQVQFVKQRTELAKAQQELKQVQQKGSVDFGNIFGEKRQLSAIKESDIFK